PIEVTLTERKHRTVGAGLGYSTDEGVGLRLSWEHRNLLHRGERLEFMTTVSEIEYSLSSQFRKPAFLRPDQSFVAKARVFHDRPDPFASRGVSSEVNIERLLSERLKLGAGVGFRNVDVEQFGRSRHYALVWLPGYGEWDYRDDRFDPGKGGRVALKGAPYFDAQDVDFGFFKSSIEYRHYIECLRAPRIVLAGRVLLGSIAAADLEEIPADVRFYAGGGGSIRGYPYLSIGPQFEDDPLGGRSLVEIGLECRAQVTKKMGVVAFLDGGTAMESEYPDFGETLRWGAGVGGRYYTPVGPVRLDVAVPLNKPDYVKDSFQVYLSLGHAF
ncbi:MAG TPA: outer membrane protein assembly factor, partial [Candidatus Hydrogenedentes bacterium]|nr:outer membrane protein assembly factor [Candidatus Hydrogenedentota bacterium]